MRGVSRSPRTSSLSPAPSLPHGQAHSSLPTHINSLRAKHWPRASPPFHRAGRAQPWLPHPGRTPDVAEICLLQNIWPWHPPCLPGTGVSSGAGRTLGSQSCGPQSPDLMGTGWPRGRGSFVGTAGLQRARVAVGRGTLSGIPGPGVPEILWDIVAAKAGATGQVCCHVLLLPGALLVPRGCKSSVFSLFHGTRQHQAAQALYLGSQCVLAWQGDRETLEGLPWASSWKTARPQLLILVMRCQGAKHPSACRPAGPHPAAAPQR